MVCGASAVPQVDICCVHHVYMYYVEACGHILCEDSAGSHKDINCVGYVL